MWRALLAFLALPGIVAFAVPLAFALRLPSPIAIRPLGIVPVVAGSALLLWCVGEFFFVGRGTLAPWDPPTRLVTTGPYRYSRNPMYVAVATILIGWAITFWLRDLVIYAAAVALAFQLRVVLVEEPLAAQKFPDAWPQYRVRVARWLF